MTAPLGGNESLCTAALAVLAQIERGDVTVTPVERHDCYSDLEFNTSNLWSFTIFCDGGWDYVDHAIMPDGTLISPYDMPFEIKIEADYNSPINMLRCYRPDRAIAKGAWGFRCE